MARTLIATLSFSFLCAALGAGAGQAADAKCTIAVKGDNQVVKACTEGGIKRAKAVMKAMTRAAKEKGKKWECDTCHKNEEDWKLSGDAEKNFKELLELTKDAK